MINAPRRVFFMLFCCGPGSPSDQPGWRDNIARAARDITDLDSGVTPRNDNGLNIDFIFTNIVPGFYFMNIVCVLVADVFVCVIPGLDPGIQVMVQIKMPLWGNGPRPSSG